MPLTLTSSFITQYTAYRFTTVHKSLQYCTKLERKHIDEHENDVIRTSVKIFFFGGGEGKLVYLDTNE